MQIFFPMEKNGVEIRCNQFPFCWPHLVIYLIITTNENRIGRAAIRNEDTSESDSRSNVMNTKQIVFIFIV